MFGLQDISRKLNWVGSMNSGRGNARNVKKDASNSPRIFWTRVSKYLWTCWGVRILSATTCCSYYLEPGRAARICSAWDALLGIFSSKFKPTSSQMYTTIYKKQCFPMYKGPQDLSKTIERNKNKVSCLKKTKTIIQSIGNSIVQESTNLIKCYTNLKQICLRNGMPRHAMPCLSMP